MHRILRELRHALRTLRRAPGFSAITVFTLALGIAGTTAAFSVVNAVLLRPLPYPDAERLIGLWHTAPGLELPQFEQSDATYLQYRKATRAFEELGAWDRREVNLTGDGEPERLAGIAVTASLFSTLQVRPALGRWFTAEEDRPGGAPAVILSHALWQRRFAGDRGIVGRTIRLDGVTREVVGVMPEGFAYPSATTQLWIPIQIDPAKLQAGNFGTNAIGRLRPGITLEQAAAEMTGYLKRLPDDVPGPITHAMMEEAKIAVVLHPLRDDVVGDIRPVLLMILGTVGVVLLIACANVANLFLVRGEGRHREIAVRTALGAAPGDLLRLALVESVALAVAGAAVGVALAAGGVRLLLRLAPSSLPRAGEIGIDLATLALAGGVAVAAGILFGALPLLRARSSELSPALRDGSRGATTGREGQRMRNGLVVAQVALALVLLLGSGLMARSFLEMRSVDPGFRPERALTFRIALPPAEYETGGEAARFHQQVLDRMAALPGVQAAGAITSIPLSGEQSNNTGTWVEDHPLPEGGLPRLHRTQYVTPGYFAAMGIPLEAGRALVPADHERPSGAVVVSRAFARRYWPNGSAIGRRVRGAPEAPWSTIVGVVGDVHDEALTKPAEELVYFPMVGLEGDSGWTARSMAYVVRTAGGDPTALAPLARREVWALDRNLPIVNIRPLSQIVSDAMARTSFILLMVALAAGIALVLGAVGIYGVISYMVSLRTREIGVRMALGARAGQVRGMIVRQGLTLAAVGVAIGVVGGIALARLFAAFLYGVRPADPLTLGATSVLLLLVAAVASFLPAHRASHIDPTDALRGE